MNITKETCISILAGYMGIKGIYNIPPNLPETEEKSPSSTNNISPPPLFLNTQPYMLPSRFWLSFVSRQVATQPIRWP
jgi:hypothetical protein